MGSGEREPQIGWGWLISLVSMYPSWPVLEEGEITQGLSPSSQLAPCDPLTTPKW